MKKTYLLDTNIVSEFSKERPDEKVLAFYAARKNLCGISAVTWQELTRGVKRMPEGKKRNTIQSFIDNLGENIEVIPYDKFSAQICGEIQSQAEKDGKVLPSYDSQIAATAISNGMILV
ncbi:MAG: PIN domain-containing protein, partial [Treponemataceae bacterium]|nr:PIN domain-containing protein [Treponemataceae bacterium]